MIAKDERERVSLKWTAINYERLYCYGHQYEEIKRVLKMNQKLLAVI